MAFAWSNHWVRPAFGFNILDHALSTHNQHAPHTQSYHLILNPLFLIVSNRHNRLSDRI